MNIAIPRTGDIGWAMDMLKEDMGPVAREDWNGKDMYLSLIKPTIPDHLPFVVMKTADDQIVPWLCSQTDLLAEDWIKYKESK